MTKNEKEGRRPFRGMTVLLAVLAVGAVLLVAFWMKQYF
jgi:hypothetical protein